MMKQLVCILCLGFLALRLPAQQDSVNSKQRLDFAKTYFEVGANYFPSFMGEGLIDNEISSFEHPASFNSYLNWGGFHFWGHAEFFVSIPLGQYTFQQDEVIDHKLTHTVATGLRIFPWIYQEQKLRPYAGISWAGLDFKQIIKPAEDQPVLSKDFLMGLDAGLLYGYRDFAFRLGINYFPQNKWAYPISRSNMTEIHTPSYSIQLGILYALDVSRKNDKQTIDRWNSYPTLSKQNSDAKTLGDFFIGIGPSSSYSLVKSSFNQEHFPYLKQRLISNPFFELTGGYHFKKAGLFTALSFRNPSFETSGFGAKQIIQKTSLALELNKFLLDYSGFTPYLGLNVAMERMKYTEEVNELRRELNFDTKANMGITLGWDIRPGKNEEALILRTNLRWYPFSSFEVDGSRFNFSQLEYNLIQVILYPGRIRKR